MKIFIKIMLLVTISATIFLGCESDGYSLNKFEATYGVVIANSNQPTNDFYVKLDNGSNIYIIANTIPGVLVETGERVYVNYTVLGEISGSVVRPSYNVRLNGLHRITSKSTVKKSLIEEYPEYAEEIGNDPVTVLDAKFSGEYLNVRFKFLGSRIPPKPHFINLIRDDVNIINGTAVVKMVRNGYTDVPTDENHVEFGYHTAFISFHIASLIPEGEKQITVVLQWDEYGKEGAQWWNEREKKQIEGFFTPYKNVYQSADGAIHEVEYGIFE